MGSETIRHAFDLRLLSATAIAAAMLTGCAASDRIDDTEDSDGESGEVEVTREQLPEVVRASLDANLPAGAVVEEIEHDAKEGTYDVEYTLGGEEFEMEITADGSFEIEADDDDSDD